MNAVKFVASPRREYPFNDTKTRPTAAKAAVIPSTIQGHRDGRGVVVAVVVVVVVVVVTSLLPRS
jgi:hypothetical protein